VLYALLAVSAFTTFYDPLPDLPIGIDLAALVLPNVGLGLLVRRYWAAAVPLLLAAPYALGGDNGSNAFSYRLSALAIGVLALASAVLVLTGVLLGTGRVRTPVYVGPALLVLGAVPLLWASYRQLRPVDEPGSREFVVEESFRGIAFGESRELVLRQLGPKRESGGTIAPIGERFEEIGAPPFIDTPGVTHEVLRYPATTVLLTENGVYGFVITADDAETFAGVGIGDNLDLAEDRYNDLECGIARSGRYRTFPYCGGMVSARRWIWFGGDPIHSITVTTTELGPD
jgi:hypothetical protein